MSDTPRTDAAQYYDLDGRTIFVVPADFARQLERELSQAHGDIRALLARLAYYEREP